MKWIELNIFLNDYRKFNEVLRDVVKPCIQTLYDGKTLFSWHYFREHHLCWRILAEESVLNSLKDKLDKELLELEASSPDVYKEHFYGAFCEKGKEYNGEADNYGDKVWCECYKLWEAGSNLALKLCTETPQEPIGYHAIRGMHLLLNPMGLTRFQEGLLHLDQARGFIKEESGYFDIFVELSKQASELLRRLKP